MIEALIDTDIMSFFFKGNPPVVANFEEYLVDQIHINICIITYDEMLSGLKAKNAKKQIRLFDEFTSKNQIITLSRQSCGISSDKYHLIFIHM